MTVIIANDTPDAIRGMLMISSDNNCQDFKIETHGDTNRRDTELSGLRLVAEKWVEPENAPF